MNADGAPAVPGTASAVPQVFPVAPIRAKTKPKRVDPWPAPRTDSAEKVRTVLRPLLIRNISTRYKHRLQGPKFHSPIVPLGPRFDTYEKEYRTFKEVRDMYDVVGDGENWVVGTPGSPTASPAPMVESMPPRLLELCKVFAFYRRNLDARSARRFLPAACRQTAVPNLNKRYLVKEMQSACIVMRNQLIVFIEAFVAALIMDVNKNFEEAATMSPQERKLWFFDRLKEMGEREVLVAWLKPLWRVLDLQWIFQAIPSDISDADLSRRRAVRMYLLTTFLVMCEAAFRYSIDTDESETFRYYAIFTLAEWRASYRGKDLRSPVLASEDDLPIALAVGLSWEV